MKEYEIKIISNELSVVELRIIGSLYLNNIIYFREELSSIILNSQCAQVSLDFSELNYCDDMALAVLATIIENFKVRGIKVNCKNLIASLNDKLNFIRNEKKSDILIETDYPNPSIEQLIKSFFKNMYLQIEFAGELTFLFAKAILNPKTIRWKDVWQTVYTGGVQAIPIILLLNFLMGLIMAFQAAIPMKQFGADIYIADLVGLSILRELGPLMTAVILAGRSSSAFAAELGTMQVNEEINALKTMGINPVRFLVLAKLVAVLIFMPLLTLFSDIAGVLGGAVVFKSFGYPLIVYYNQLSEAVHLYDFLGGFFKSFVFAILIAAIGCLKGLQTKNGASSVGLSTTSAVVSGLIIIVIVDGIFSVIYYYLGI